MIEQGTPVVRYGIDEDELRSVGQLVPVPEAIAILQPFGLHDVATHQPIGVPVEQLFGARVADLRISGDRQREH